MGTQTLVLKSQGKSETDQADLSQEEPIEREIKTTRAEMEAQNVPNHWKDYCLDYYMGRMRCRHLYPHQQKSMCSQYVHAHEMCVLDDTIGRMKEWERERRLKERAKRIKAKREAGLID